ncbi:hypothetical protein IT415_01080 [bacterium]|nr:hypothetical protein [bacterium]
MSYKCAFRLSIRWGILAVIVGYAIIGVGTQVVGRPIHYDRLMINLGDREIPYTSLPSVSGWLAPLGLFIPVSIFTFVHFVTDQLQARRDSRGRDSWEIETQTLLGFVFGIFGTLVVGGAGIAPALILSAICMTIIVCIALVMYNQDGWDRLADLSQVMMVPITTSLVMLVGLTLLVGPIASLILASITLATAYATFAVFVLPLLVNKITKRQQRTLSEVFRRTMLECDPAKPEKR